MDDPYLAAIQRQSIGASTTDGFSTLTKITETGWTVVTELTEVEAADVLRNTFPGSFDSPE